MISYKRGSYELLDQVKPIWEKLIEHHKIRSVDFRHEFEIINFDIRKNMLDEKAGQGSIIIDLAVDMTTNQAIGYCISSLIHQTKKGEIESIYVEADYRGQGIGETLIKRALAWMDEQGTYERAIVVASGNEEVLAFYARFGFFPRQIHLKQI